MDISTIAFKRMYELLTQKIWDDELTDAQKKKLKKMSYAIWAEDDPGKKGANFFDTIFNGVGLDRNHYWRKARDFNPNTGRNLLPLDDKALIAISLYIGVTYPKNVNKKDIRDDDQKANVLYQEFKATLLDDDERLEVEAQDRFDVNAAEKIIGSNKKDLNKTKNKEISIEGMNYDIEKVVGDFYHLLSASQIEKAWSLLTKNFQQRGWKGKYEDFAIGYTNLLAIKDVHVWDINIQDITADCKVFYMDKVLTFTDRILTDLDKITIGDVEELVRVIKKVLEKAGDTELKGFENIEVCKLFEPAASEYIWYKCGKNPEYIKSLMPIEKTMELPRLYNLTFSLVDGAWLISSITPIRSHLYR
ncbi:hypothetical protein [Mucilaginibacter polytrichastri]|uniref:Uncharacterized protein n=1 Tax=Mucilaginibacter polytrichastri TaxID=1302689 RepID=A0A1Q6A2G7_9SPHI|nr:hypothetical protein [Mucilaginibacter polytrichastri]OKS88181.1 hypothetical protein RG47T_3645 [Mucilaginibacter polytrichastri]SFT08796.1 hypothetical protein SAMN04487890_11060 [Mucilaginibacter polytrichastri]